LAGNKFDLAGKEFRLNSARDGARFTIGLQAMHDLTKTKPEVGETIARDIQPRAA
jgi:hypothetical protein